MVVQNFWRNVLLLSLAASPLAALADPVYTMTFLPCGFQAARFNSAGRIVGPYNGAAATWSDAGIAGIGAVAPGSAGGAGGAINHRGDIGGAFQGDACADATGVLRNIGQHGGSASSHLTAMNDAGQMTGNLYFGMGERWRGFVDADGVVRPIPTFGGDWSWAAAINSSGQVAGTSALFATRLDGPHHAFLYQGGVARDIGTLGGGFSDASDINDAGQPVG